MASRAEVTYSNDTKMYCFLCCAGAQRIELCRRGFWGSSGYLSLTPLDCFRPLPTCGFGGLPGSDWIAFAGFLIDPEGGYIGMLAPA